MSLLDSVGDFRGLYGLGEDELGALCAELRERILDVTLKNGGHLRSCAKEYSTSRSKTADT